MSKIKQMMIGLGGSGTMRLSKKSRGFAVAQIRRKYIKS